MSIVKGGCLCGTIRYEVNGPLGRADNCHCSMCRKQHGAAFATYADINPDDFTWVNGVDCINVYETASGAGWCFCGKCGSTLAGTTSGQVTSITLGAVDGDPCVKPESHIFIASKANWFEITDDVPKFKERQKWLVS